MHVKLAANMDKITLHQDGCQSGTYVSMWNLGLDKDFQVIRIKNLLKNIKETLFYWL